MRFQIVLGIVFALSVSLAPSLSHGGVVDVLYLVRLDVSIRTAFAEAGKRLLQLRGYTCSALAEG